MNYKIYKTGQLKGEEDMNKTGGIIAVGDNVCDKYLSRGKMYPGGQCINTCVYTAMNDTNSAYIGKFGNDEVADCVKDTLEKLSIDYSRSKTYEGENGFALVTLKGNDRVFLGSNKGGIAKEHKFEFSEADLDYIDKFDIIYTNLNSYIEDDLKTLYDTQVPIAYDFSTRWTDEYLKRVAPYVTVAIMSCAHLTDEEREREMKKARDTGITVVLGTIGEEGSYALYKDKMLYTEAVHADNIIDTMGAGDSYFATFLCSMLKSSENGKLVSGSDSDMETRILNAMKEGAKFSAYVCSLEGAFGYGVPIKGRTEI